MKTIPTGLRALLCTMPLLATPALAQDDVGALQQAAANSAGADRGAAYFWACIMMCLRCGCRDEARAALDEAAAEELAGLSPELLADWAQVPAEKLVFCNSLIRPSPKMSK